MFASFDLFLNFEALPKLFSPQKHGSDCTSSELSQKYVPFDCAAHIRVDESGPLLGPDYQTSRAIGNVSKAKIISAKPQSFEINQKKQTLSFI